MTMNDFQIAAMRTQNIKMPEHKVLNGVMGLNGEAGECIDLVKKWKYQGHDLDRTALADELGDVLWYLAETACGIGWTLEDIAQRNIEKLKRRYPEGFDAERSVHRED